MDKHVLMGNNAQFIKFPFEHFIQAVKKNGLSEIDFTSHVPHIYVDSDGYMDICNVKEKLAEAEISVGCLTPLPYRFSICADEGTVQREKTIEYYRQCILLAKELGSPYVTITGSGACYDYEPEDLRSRGVKTLRELADFAEAEGVTLLLGTVLGEECPYNASTPVFVKLWEIKDALKQVESPNLKAYLDTEVISLCGETITQWFEELGDNIELVRFTDGNYNGYRIWGMGCLPCKKYLQEVEAAGYKGKFSLNIPGERYTDDPEAMLTKNVEYIRERSRQV